MMIEKYFGIDRETARKMVDATKGMMHEKSGDNGFQNTKVYLFDEYAVLKMQNIDYRNVTVHDSDLEHLRQLAETLLVLQAEGVNAVPILAFRKDGNDGYIIQPRAKGAELYDREKSGDKDYVPERIELLSKAPQSHYDKFAADIIKITEKGVIIDFVGKDNFFYHESTGFQFIDLNAHYDYIYGLEDVKPPTDLILAYGCFVPCYYDTVPKYRDNAAKLLSTLNKNEHLTLCQLNERIFQKCKNALLTNGIEPETLREIIADERFIPQKNQLGLI